MEKYLTKQKNLMSLWKKSRPDQIADFVSDGIIHPATWFESSGEKVLFILKEAYSARKDEEWDLAKWLCGEKCTKTCFNQCSKCWPTGYTYNHVAEQAHMILAQSEIFDEWLGAQKGSRISYLNAKKKILKEIAVINIKKFSGAKRSRARELRRYTEDYKGMLKEQIEIIRPTVIVCGGTYTYLQQIFDLPTLDNPNDGGINFNGIKIIAVGHPNQRITSKEKAEKVARNYFLLKEST